MTRPRILIPFQKRAHDHRRCVDAALAEAESACRHKGLRFTALRRRVLTLIWTRHAPIKAYDILARLRREGRRAAPPTVYRALEFLLEAGLVHRIESLNAYVGCGGAGTPHVGQFLICRRCSAVAEVDTPAIAKALAADARRLGFTADRQTIEVRGLCAECSRLA